MRARVLVALVVLAVSTTGSFASPAREPRPRCFNQRATITGTPGDDVLVGTRGPDVIAGGDGDDVVRGRGGGDALCGDGGADTIAAGKSRRMPHSNPGSTMFGGEGDDVLRGTDFTDFLDGGGGADTIRGRGGGDYLHGYVEVPSDTDALDGDDRLFGGHGRDFFNAEGGRPPDGCCSSDPGDDELFGGDGVDVLSAGSGSDLLDGGAGADWASFDSAVVADLTLGTATTGEDTDTLTGIENLQGSSLDDTLVGDDGPNKLWDSNDPEVPDADTLRGLGGDDEIQTYFGDDVVEGGDGDDYFGVYCCVDTDEDDDAFYGGAGDDRLGGASSGSDHFDGGDGADVVSWEILDVGAVEADLVEGMAIAAGRTSTLTAIENLTGGDNADLLYGDGGPNLLRGDYGNDHLDGRDGLDTLDGGAGDGDVCVNGESLRSCEG